MNFQVLMRYLDTTLKYKVKTEIRSRLNEYIYNDKFTKCMPTGYHRLPADLQNARHITNDRIREYEF